MKKLQNKLLLRFLPLFIIPIMLTAIICIVATSRQLRENFTQRLNDTLQGAEIEIETIKKDLLNSVQEIAAEEALKESVRREDRQALLSILERSKNVLGVNIAEAFTPEGIVLAEGHRPTNYGQDESYKKMFQQALKDQTVAGMEKSDFGIGIEVFMPVKTDETIIAVLEYARLLDYRFVTQIKAKYGLESIVYDGTRLQATTFTDSRIINDPALKTLRNDVQTAKENIVKEMTLAGERYFVIGTPILSEKEPLGCLFLALSSETIFQTTLFFTALFCTIILVLIVVTSFLCQRISANIVKPIKTLSIISQEIAKGSLAKRVNIRCEDEIGVLADSFNKMTDELDKTIHELTDYQDSLEEKVTERTEALAGSNKQLKVREQQLHAANEQLEANYQQLTASELELRESKEYLENIFETSVDGIMILDEAGKILRANKAIEQMLGYQAGELIGKYTGELSVRDEEHRNKTMAMIEQLFENGFVKNWQAEWHRKDGSLCFTEANLTLLKDPEGNHIGSMGAIRDITDRKQMENLVRQSQKMEAIGTLAGGIAHDFNNILSGIVGLTELSLDDVREMPETYDYLKGVLKSADRATDLVKQILTFSRQTEHEKEQLTVLPIIKEVTKFLRSTLPTTIEFLQTIKTENDLIMADPTQIHQVLMNLCTNAGHAMKETGGVLEVVMDEINLTDEDLTTYTNLKSGPYLKLTVSDTGHGIERENLERIFEPYFTTKKVGEGTGLGLAVVHGIVKDHGGDIKVYSEVGKGTTFQVCFPLLKKEEVTTEKKPTVQIPTGNETILFVDDEETLVYAGKHILERLGYTVVISSDADEALEIFKKDKETFDLVITDKTMPHITGFDLARETKNIRSDIPVIMCTGFNAKTDLAKANEVGIQEFVMKPLNKRQLAETVRKVLDKKEPLLTPENREG